jgi:hypothetical protein
MLGTLRVLLLLRMLWLSIMYVVFLYILSCNSFAILTSRHILLVPYLIICFIIIHFSIVPFSVYFPFDAFHTEDVLVFLGMTPCGLVCRFQRFGYLAVSSGFFDRVGACVPVFTASYPRRLSLHQHCCDNLISCTFSVLFVFSSYILSNTTRRILTRTRYIGDMFRLTL